MPSTYVPVLAFNRGIIDKRALSRIDVNENNRVAFSAEEQTNIMPTVMGSAALRPGTQYLFNSKNNDTAIAIPFIYDEGDTAFIELTDQNMRVCIDDVIISRPSVTSAITNGTFTGSLAGWTDADEGAAVSSYHASDYLQLVGTGIDAAIRYQLVSVTGGNIGVEHALNIRIIRSPVTFRAGTALGLDDYITESVLAPGWHSLALTPSGSFYVEFLNREVRMGLVDSCVIASSGEMNLVAPWQEADLPSIRTAAINDVIFCDCYGYKPQRIERRSARSWSVVHYEPEDGPFLPINTGSATIAASALNGDITLTASRDLFKSGHVGALFRISSRGQRVETSFTAEDQYSDPIRVTGVTELQRTFSIIIAGTFTATIRLQGSYGDDSNWVNTSASWSGAGTFTFFDMLPNQIVYYRLAIQVGDYTSGTADTTLVYSAGSITGVARITEYTDSVTVGAAVLKPLGGVDPTAFWEEGQWSDYRGWPSAVADYEGRLWHAGKQYINATASETVDSFDDTVTTDADATNQGDAAPITKTIGSDRACWLLPMQRLIAGLPTKVMSIRATSFDESLTTTNFNRKTSTSYRAANIAPSFADAEGIFVSGTRVYRLTYGSENNDYVPIDLTRYCPAIGEPGIVCIAVQRLPDTRIHAVRTNGTMATFVYSRLEDVECWVEVETDGNVEFAFVLPGGANETEDRLYWLVSRTVNGVPVRHWEKHALASECVGGDLNKNLDSHKVYSGAPATVMTGLGHLEGKSLRIWADGKQVTSKTVSGGQITLDVAASKVVMGLLYRGTYKSSKLHYGSPGGVGLNQPKRVSALGFILLDTSQRGLQYGINFDELDALPLMEDFAEVDPDEIRPYYDAELIEFDGDTESDPRFCLQMSAPHPCTISAVTLKMKANDK